jgi:CBS domain-containing protein
MSEMLVSALMSKKPRTIYADETADLAELLMSLGSIRHLPVVDREGRLVGVVSNRDVLRAGERQTRPEGPRLLKHSAVLVKETMSPDVLTIRPNTSAREAAPLMRKNQFGCLPIVAEGRLDAIVTESDCVELAATLLSSK